MTSAGFEPSEIEIKNGETVLFENTDTRDRWPASNIHPTHGIYPEFDPKKLIKPGESWEFKFDKPGQWKFHDHIIPEFIGEINVVDNPNQPKTEAISKPENVFTRLLNYLKYNYSKLTRVLFFYEKESSSTEPSSKKWLYDEEIARDSDAVFTDENALYSYIKKFGFEKTISQLVNLSAKFGDCHNTAHKAGRLSFEIYGNQVFAEPAAPCHSGGYHGATEAYFAKNGTDNLSDKLKTICASAQNPFFSHQCVHGIGHGLMAWMNYEIHDALKSCDLLDTIQASCYSGIFMENIVGGLSQESGHSTKYLNDDPHYPCTVVLEKYKSACYFYQTSRMVQLFHGDFAKIAEECNKISVSYINACFGSMGRDISSTTRFHPKDSISKCSFAPKGQRRNECLMGAVQDYFWTPEGTVSAIEFCKILRENTEKSSCYQTIIPRAKDVLADSSSLQNFCHQLEPSFKKQCLLII